MAIFRLHVKWGWPLLSTGDARLFWDLVPCFVPIGSLSTQAHQLGRTPFSKKSEIHATYDSEIGRIPTSGRFNENPCSDTWENIKHYVNSRSSSSTFGLPREDVPRSLETKEASVYDSTTRALAKAFELTETKLSETPKAKSSKKPSHTKKAGRATPKKPPPSQKPTPLPTDASDSDDESEGKGRERTPTLATVVKQKQLQTLDGTTMMNLKILLT